MAAKTRFSTVTIKNEPYTAVCNTHTTTTHTHNKRLSGKLVKGGMKTEECETFAKVLGRVHGLFDGHHLGVDIKNGHIERQ